MSVWSPCCLEAAALGGVPKRACGYIFVRKGSQRHLAIRSSDRQTLCRINDCVMRLGVVQGDYVWHQHDDEDEFFYVVEGRLFMDLEDRTIELAERQGLSVPMGVRHRTRAPERTVILIVEGAGVVPTGD